MYLKALVTRLGSSIDEPRDPSERRFNSAERREIFQALSTAPRSELEDLRRMLGEDAFFPKYAFAKRPARMWLDGDAQFRQELVSAVDQRLGNPNRPVYFPNALDGDDKALHNRCAVVLIDTQYTDHPPPEIEIEKRHMAHVLKRARAEAIPVFEVVLPQYETDPAFATLRDPKTWVRIEKAHTSAFQDTNLVDELHRHGVRTLVLMGLNEEYCVQRTAQDAVEAGYRVVTSPEVIQHSGDAGGTRAPDWFYQDPNVTVVSHAEDLPTLPTPQD